MDNQLKRTDILALAKSYDSLSTIEELLYSSKIDCVVDAVSSCSQAETFLKSHAYDLTVLEITGFEIDDFLKIINRHDIHHLVITSHAFASKYLRRSIEHSNVSYLSKDQLVYFNICINDILTCKKQRNIAGSALVKSCKSFIKNTLYTFCDSCYDILKNLPSA